MRQMKNIKLKNFKNLLKVSDKTVLMLSLPTCPPCKQMKPVFWELSDEWTDVSFIVVNAMDFPDYMSEYEVMSAPTFIFFDGEKEDHRVMGKVSKSDFEKSLRLING